MTAYRMQNDATLIPRGEQGSFGEGKSAIAFGCGVEDSNIK